VNRKIPISFSIDGDLLEIVDKIAGPHKRSETICQAIAEKYQDRRKHMFAQINKLSEEALKWNIYLQIHDKGAVKNAKY